MLTLYHAPRTRSVRIVWLLEELGVPYELRRVDFRPPSERFFSQQTPLGKLPVIEDDDVVICESGAIVEHVLERHGDGRLMPPPGTAARAEARQWMYFAEGTAFPPLGIIVAHTVYWDPADPVPTVIARATERAHQSLAFVAEHGLRGRDHLVGEFSAADVMMGFSVAVARVLGLLDQHPELTAYLERLEARPAFQRALAV